MTLVKLIREGWLEPAENIDYDFSDLEITRLKNGEELTFYANNKKYKIFINPRIDLKYLKETDIRIWETREK